MINPYTRLEFIHANLNRPVFIMLGQVIGFHWAETVKSMVIYTTGGAVFPVKEDKDQIDSIINKAINPFKGEEKNESGTTITE